VIAATTLELELLRNGTLDVSNPLSFEQLTLSSFTNDLLATHGYVFQRRQIGRKLEIGMARKVSFQMTFQASSRSLFLNSRLYPNLVDCYLLSGYDDVLSEITWAQRLYVRPAAGQREVTLAFGRGYKLDKSDEGWTLKPLLRRRVKLSEQVLSQRGWQFDLLNQIRAAKP
jgi:hypothetical protein